MQSLLRKSEQIIIHQVSAVHPNIGLIMEVGLYLSLCLLVVPASSYWLALSSLEMRVYTLSCCILLCQVLFLPLRNLIFSEGRQRRYSGPGGEVVVGERKKEREREMRYLLGYSDKRRISKYYRTIK